MTAMTSTAPPTVVQTVEERLADLASDLEAVGGFKQGAAPDGALTRPAILRRTGALLATKVPPGTDRIVCHPDDALLGVAVSLHTGVPLAIVDPTGATQGELHATEHVVVVGYFDLHRNALAAKAADVGVMITAISLVFGNPGSADSSTTALFATP